MAERHPYTSGTAGIVQAVNQFRESLPGKVNAGTLRKLGIAPNNESYLINILKFIEAIDDEGNATDQAKSVFAQHEVENFRKGFGGLVKTAYADLFELHKEKAWTLPLDKLISFFRNTDKTSAIVGKRQAGTFLALAGLSGYGEVPAVKAPIPRQDAKTAKMKTRPAGKGSQPEESTLAPPVIQQGGASKRDMALTVRIEVNLPAGGDQETYDRIFKSIRANLLNGD